MSFSLRLVQGRGPEDKFSVAVQQVIPNCEVDEGICTNYSLIDRRICENVSKYIAHHELKIRRRGRANGRPFEFYYEPHTFPFYYDSSKKLIVIGTKKQVASSFLTEAELSNHWTAVPVDYVNIIPLLPPITGAWFCKMKQQYLNAAAYFGNHVDRSDEYKRAAASGQISVLYINVPWPAGGPEVRVGITNDGVIVLAQDLELEVDRIKLVSHVYETYIVPTLASRTE